MANYDWDAYESDGDNKTTTDGTFADLRSSLIQPLGIMLEDSIKSLETNTTNSIESLNTSIQFLTDLLVKINTGIEPNLYKTMGTEATYDADAIEAFKKVIYGDPNDQDSPPAFSAAKVAENTAIASETHINALIEALSQVMTGKNYDVVKDSDNNISDMTSQVMTGKKYDDIKDSDNNISDMTSKVITGKKYDDLVLEQEGGESGEYDSTLNGRLQKTTEILSGILIGIFTEDEIKEKLASLDVNKLSSIEENLGAMNEKASLFKTKLRRESTFTLDNGDEHNQNSPLNEIERAIKAMAIAYTYGDLKGDVKMAELKKSEFPENIPRQFWEDLKHAYAKFSGDFVRTINEFDGDSTDNNKYGDNFNLTDKN